MSNLKNFNQISNIEDKIFLIPEILQEIIYNSHPTVIVELYSINKSFIEQLKSEYVIKLLGKKLHWCIKTYDEFLEIYRTKYLTSKCFDYFSDEYCLEWALKENNLILSSKILNKLYSDNLSTGRVIFTVELTKHTFDNEPTKAKIYPKDEAEYLNMAIKSNNLDTVKWAYNYINKCGSSRKNNRNTDISKFIPHDTLYHAIETGNILIFDYIFKLSFNNPIKFYDNGRRIWINLLEKSFISGNIEMIYKILELPRDVNLWSNLEMTHEKFTHDNITDKLNGEEITIKWCKNAMQNAILSGNKSMIEFTHSLINKYGIKLEEKSCIRGQTYKAIESKNIELIKFYVTKQLEFITNKNIDIEEYESDNDESNSEFIKNTIEKIIEEIVDCAIWTKELKILKYVLSRVKPYLKNNWKEVALSSCWENCDINMMNYIYNYDTNEKELLTQNFVNEAYEKYYNDDGILNQPGTLK